MSSAAHCPLRPVLGAEPMRPSDREEPPGATSTEKLDTVPRLSAGIFAEGLRVCHHGGGSLQHASCTRVAWVVGAFVLNANSHLIKPCAEQSTSVCLGERWGWLPGDRARGQPDRARELEATGVGSLLLCCPGGGAALGGMRPGTGCAIAEAVSRSGLAQPS